MPPQSIEAAHFSPDTREFIRLLDQHGVRYVIVGGEAVIYYGYARLTGDVDFFYDRDVANVRALFAALTEFWDGSIPGISDMEELLEEGLVVQFGRPPNRIDLLNGIDGIGFAEAWTKRNTTDLELAPRGPKVKVHFLSRACLIRNKQAAARPKDLDDLEYLRRAGEGAGS